MNLAQARLEYERYKNLQQQGTTPMSFEDWQIRFKIYPINQ